MTAFVTGGSGFLGGRLIEILVERGESVRGLARSDGSAKKVRARGGEPVRGDLDAIEAMVEGMDGCDVVYHSAAKVEDWGRPRDFHRINVEGTANVIEAARRAGVECLVHVSTEAQFAGGSMANLDESSVRPKKPIGLYARTKALADDLVRQHNSSELRTSVVRPRFIWGKGDTSLMPKLNEMAESGKLRWIGGGTDLTSTCNVDNVVEGMLLAAERCPGGEAYFLTDGEPVQIREFISELLRTQGIEPPTGTVPRWLARAGAWTAEGIWRLFRIRRPPPVTRMAVCLVGQEVTVNDAKARRELGYQAEVTIEEGLAAMRAEGRIRP
jgi:nucleoside-diphosphate-sugar epimerase